ncbi:MAG: Mut7-C RNAse domain-containing protein [Elusimicrobia bacterium]|nr:Mut7-C RNAse domain-containing protein [Elusimicrobiota bacterium]
MTPKFLADGMLGRLSKWLVLLGFDCRCVGWKGEADAALLEIAQNEGRIFLTRDANIPEVKGLRKIVLPMQALEDQIRFVLRNAGVKARREKLFSRCTACNVELDQVAKEEAAPLAPPLVREAQTVFFRCPACKKLYWNGTHTANTAAKFEKMGVFG